MYNTKKTKSFILFFLFSLLSILPLSCGSKNIGVDESEENTNQFTSNKIKVSTFNISLSTAGGVTGLGSGYTLTSEGDVKYWEQISFVKDTTLWTKKVNIEKLINFKNELDSCGILQKEYNGTGNMTTTVDYILSDTSYTWTWADNGADEDAPQEIANWYERIMKFCNEIK